jgi:hypothetical protein
VCPYCYSVKVRVIVQIFYMYVQEEAFDPTSLTRIALLIHGHQVVPEPSTVILLCCGDTLLVVYGRWRTSYSKGKRFPAT